MKEFYPIVNEILVEIHDNQTYNSSKEKYHKEIFEDSIEYAVSLNLINGVSTFRNELGDLQIDSIPNISITDDGLTFMKRFK